MDPALHWFCLKAQTKREHIAADHLRQIPGITVFLPRVRFRRKTVRGLVWFTEALFPGYVFARFDFQQQFRQVNHASGVRGVVHFGERWPTIPDETIAELQLALGTENICTINDPLVVGEEIEVASGAFRGLKAVVSRVMPARERVLVLLDFLGRQTSVEIGAGDVIREGDQRRRAFSRD
jgi:transcriptional antiterminator RfaH